MIIVCMIFLALWGCVIGTTSNKSETVITISQDQPNIGYTNGGSYVVSGSCSESGQVVAVTFIHSDGVSADRKAEVTCEGGSWKTVGINFADLLAGAVKITARHNGVEAASVTVQRIVCIPSNPSSDTAIGSTAENPIIICDYEGLKKITTQGLDKHYKVGSDIDAQASWSEGEENCGAYDGTNIASSSPCAGMAQFGHLTGSFDGGGYVIGKLYLHNSGGLFARSGLTGRVAPIKNVHLRELRVVDTNTALESLTGGLIDDADYAQIDNCSVGGHIFGSGATGGLAGGNGTNGSVVIYNSYAHVRVNGRHAGGVLGSVGTSGGRVVSSYAKGHVTGNGSNYSLVGGLVGLVNIGVILNSYADIRVSGGSKQGSLIGSMTGTISNSYGVGEVVGTGTDTGGLVGDASLEDGGVTFQNLFWDTTTTTQSSSDGVDGQPTTTGGLSTAQMQVACTEGSTAGICALGAGFIFTENEYPKIKKCTSSCDTNTPVFGTELIGGQEGS